MRILFVIKNLALPGGGAERVLAAVGTALAGRGHEVTVLSFDPPGTTDFYVSGPAVRRLRLGKSASRGHLRLLSAIGELGRIRTAVHALRPDVAIGFMYSAFVTLPLALIGTGVPVVGSERTAYAHYRAHPLHRIGFVAMLPFLAQLTVNGARIREGYPSAIAAKMKVVPNPVPPRSGLADPVGGELKTLLCVGGLRREKDHATLLRAFAQIADRFPDWRLRIVGEGPMRSALEAQIAKSGLVGRAELAGATNMVDREYRAAQLFVLPSLYEAFPNCLAEALAHGLPAVGFADCPGTNDLIIPGVNGTLASGTDRGDSLASALANLMASASLRSHFGEAAPMVAMNHGIEEITELWERLLQSVVRIRREGQH